MQENVSRQVLRTMAAAMSDLEFTDDELERLVPFVQAYLDGMQSADWSAVSGIDEEQFLPAWYERYETMGNSHPRR